MAQPQPSDVGFGYMSQNNPSKHSSYAGVEIPLTPASPLRSALKPPGTPGRFANPLSPTFREEQILEKEEESTEKQQAADLVSVSLIHNTYNGADWNLESEDSCPDGQDGTPRHEFQL